MKRKILLCLGGFCLSAVAQRVEMVTTTASERWKNQKVKVQKIHEGKADIDARNRGLWRYV